MPKLNWREGSPRFRSLNEQIRICKRTSVTPNMSDCRYRASSMTVSSILTTLVWSQSSMILVGDKSYSSSLLKAGLLYVLSSSTMVSLTQFKRLDKWMQYQMLTNELGIADTDQLAFLVMICSGTHIFGFDLSLILLYTGFSLLLYSISKFSSFF